jgi:hypothetical protein
MPVANLARIRTVSLPNAVEEHHCYADLSEFTKTEILSMSPLEVKTRKMA